jgi:hypothetical protein
MFEIALKNKTFKMKKKIAKASIFKLFKKKCVLVA